MNFPFGTTKIGKVEDMHEAVRATWEMGQKGHAIQITEDSRGGKFISAQVHHYLTCKQCEKEVRDGEVKRDRKVTAIEAKIEPPGEAGGRRLAVEDRSVQVNYDGVDHVRTSPEIFSREEQEKAFGGGSFALLYGDGSAVSTVGSGSAGFRDTERSTYKWGDYISADRGVPSERGQGETPRVGNDGVDVRALDCELPNARRIDEGEVNKRPRAATRSRGISKNESALSRRKLRRKRRVKKNGKR